MAKGNRRNRRKGGKTIKRATRNVELQLQPQLGAIDRAEEQARDDYADYGAQAEGIYRGLSDELAPLREQFQTASEGISSGLEQSLSDFAQGIGLSSMDTVGPETAAALGAYGSIGGTGLSQLASDQSRNLGFQTSAQRQAGIERMEVARNLLQELQENLDELRSRRLDVRDTMPDLIRREAEALREQRLTQQLARSQMRSDEAFSQALQDQLSGLMGGGGGGRGRGYMGGDGDGYGADDTDVGSREGPGDSTDGRGPVNPHVPRRTTGSVPPLIRRWLRGDFAGRWDELTPKQRRRIRRSPQWRRVQDEIGDAVNPGPYEPPDWWN